LTSLTIALKKKSLYVYFWRNIENLENLGGILEGKNVLDCAKQLTKSCKKAVALQEPTSWHS